MNKLIKYLSICLLITYIGTTVNATPINVGDRIQAISYNPLTNAGEFILHDLDTDYIWGTFCLEINSVIPQFSYVGGISDSAIPGGAGGVTATGDPISDFTAWLYLSAETNTLVGYEGTNTDAYDLQNLIWYEEEELSIETMYLDPIQVNQWRSIFTTLNWTNNGEVQVVNLFADPYFKIHAQDQLIYSFPAPEPSTLLLLGCSLILMGNLYRKM